MKYLAPFSLMLLLSIAAYAQQPDADSHRAVGADTQVAVHLQIAEISLTKLQKMGFDLSRVLGDSEAKPNIEKQSFNAQWSAITKDGAKARQVLETLRKNKLAKILAEPTLVTTNGRMAVFNSGGELSVPKPQPDGSIKMERQHANTIEFRPEVLGNRVHLEIRGKLCETDDQHSLQAGNQTVPGVRTREFATRTELESGQTFAVIGLTQVRMETIARGLPYICEVPYLGAVFHHVEEQRNEVALLVLVRPEIVSPPAKPIPSHNAAPQGEPHAVQPASFQIPKVFRNSP
jgi:pilus assembly protein CpaC